MKNEETKNKKNNNKKVTKKQPKVEEKNTNKKKTTTNKKNETKKAETKKVEKKIIVEEIVSGKTEKVDKPVTKKKIKTGDIALVGILVVALILGFFLMKGEKYVPGYELPLKLTGEPGLQELTYKEYMEKVNNDESFVFIVESATCSHCVTYMPIAEKTAKDNNLPMYYIDTNKLTQEDWASFETSNTFFKEKNGNWGTPTTIVLAGKEHVGYVEGTVDEDRILQLYNDYFDMK